MAARKKTSGELRLAAVLACRVWRREPNMLSRQLNDAMFRLEEIAKIRMPKPKRRAHAK